MQRLIFIFIFLTLPLFVSAADLYFAPASAPEGEYAVGVLLDAEKPVNVMEGAVRIPAGTVFLRASDGGSVVSLWIEPPAFDTASGALSFAGMIPGGFSGKGGKILTLYFTRKEESAPPGTFSFDASQTKLYENTGEGALAEMNVRTLPLTEEFFKHAEEELPAPFPDVLPPEKLYSAISRDPALHEGKYFLVFAASDKNSGIASYFAAESEKNAEKNTKEYDSLVWYPADSPYVLLDQTRRAHVYIKAIDHAGNERVEVIASEKEFSTPFGVTFALISSIILLIGAFSALAFVLWKRKDFH